MPRSLKEVNRSGFLRQQKGGDKTFTFTYTRMEKISEQESVLLGGGNDHM
jgi:hypothetical protein